MNPSSRPAELTANSSGHKRQSSGDNYYEDVEPRFVEHPPSDSGVSPTGAAPGYANAGSSGGLQPLGGLDGNSSYEDIQSGSRSPAESDRSNFTSVSQRGVNPRWNGGGNGYGPPMPNQGRRPPPQRNDILLNSNPDFQLPGARGGRNGGQGRGRIPGQIPGGGMVPGSAYPGGAL